MSRRTWAGLTALALLVVCIVATTLIPVPYVVFRPGPTVNILGDYDHKPILDATGHRTYRDGGDLRLVTIYTTPENQQVHLPELLAAWLSRHNGIYPREVVYGPHDTGDSVRQQQAVQMSSSQDNAVAAAMTALHLPVKRVIKVAAVEKNGPAAGKLERNDVITAVDGHPVAGLDSVTARIKSVPVGRRVTLSVRRGGVDRQVALTTTTSPTDPKSSAVRIQVGQDFSFPFRVLVRLPHNIGGPSGGMMFALAVYDVLTPGSLTHGSNIAGTGEIDGDGKVGEIGGIGQKIAGAQHDGARLFLVPAGNCAEAQAASFDHDRVRLAKVSTFENALRTVQTYTADPHAQLPECTR